MTVFVAHAHADEEIADSLAKVIERRGNFVEHEQAERIGRPLGHMDVLVLLWSQKMMFEPGRLVMERRALDAWADGKLIIVILDRTILPTGLRDLPVVDATFDQRRAFTWEDVAGKVRESVQASIQNAPPQAETAAPGGGLSRKRAAPKPASAQAPRAPASPPRRPAAKRSGALGGIFALLFLLILAAGVFLFVAGNLISLPIAGGITLPPWSLLAVAGGLALIGGVVKLLTSRSEPEAAAPPSYQSAPAPMDEAEATQAAAPPASSAVFVSYAHLDSSSVAPVVAAVKHEGREVWMDNAGIQAGEGWAGEIVRAIKGAHGVMVMCSAHAFQSDHVKREVYLADRYKKPMLPVFIEAAELPEDFEYFFAGVQWLELHKTPEADRAAAIAKAVAAV